MYKRQEVQKLAEQGVSYAQDIFKSIGVYLGHTLCLYEMLYDIRNLGVLGRVASGVGGDLIVAECQRVLSEEYPELDVYKRQESKQQGAHPHIGRWPSLERRGNL